ncbi:hypothetical protein F5B18DRAFT_668261 [Nemania serpens]|nr:hypothetical protein F5B18DRAFT_668261 [Nemania serpens]
MPGEQTRYHQRDTVRISTISNQEASARYPARNQIKTIDEETRAAAKVIAEVQIDSPSSDVILTANGYKKKAALKNALVNIDYDNTKAVLKFMLKDGAYLYKAVCQQEIVGAVVIVRLPGEFSLHPSSSGTPAPQGLPFPPIHDLKAVKAYARCKDVDDDFSYQLRGLLNSRLRYHGVGQLWEFSFLSVKEGFRHQNIGRTLVQHALSKVPSRDTVVILAEPGTEAMYQHLGFNYAVSASNTLQAVRVRPEWVAQGHDWIFHIMVLQK